MKRYGKENLLAELKKGAYIRFNDYFMIDGGYRLYNSDDELLGYITYDLFAKLWAQGGGELVKIRTGFSFEEYAIPVTIEIDTNDDESDEQPEAPTMDTPDTIQPKAAYSVHFPKLKTKTADSDSERVLLDGGGFVMRCKRREYSDFVDDMRQNECFNLCEIFSTSSAKWAYWRDEEADEDYITKIGNYSDIITAYFVVNGKIRKIDNITQREYLDTKKSKYGYSARVDIFRTEEEAKKFIKNYNK